jgi:fluoroquinolone resistance protein
MGFRVLTFAFYPDMESVIHEDKTFEKVVYAEKAIKGREFQSCTFKKCDFTNSDFSHNRFRDCIFESCNLSMMKLMDTTLSNAVFAHCKAVGVNFSECDNFLFSVRFDSCILDYASFMGKKMPKTRFAKTSLKEVSFIQANLTGSVFDDTDLDGAIFNGTDLASADLVTAYNFTIDPELNNIRKASFASAGLHGLLAKYQIKIV